MSLITCFLTCANTEEANEIAAELLDKKLAACVKQFKAGSAFRWQGQVDSANEVMLVIDSQKSKFPAIEKAMRRVHSYDLPVLVAYDVAAASKGVEKWVKESAP